MASSDQAKRIGVIGAGVIGRSRLEVWPRLGVTVAGVCARHLDRAAAAARGVGCDSFDSMATLLEQSNIADICLPTFLHRQAVEQAVRAGCDIVCEKPLAITVADVDAIFNLCDAAGVRLFVAMVVRFFPPYRNAYDSVQAGTLGDVQEIRLKRVGSPPPPLDSWFQDDELSGGMLTDLLIHDVDYATWLAGDVSSVVAAVTRDQGVQYAHVTLKHTNGVVTRIEGGWAASGPPLQTSGTVVCSNGVAEISSDESWKRSTDPYEDQLRHFLCALGTGTPFLVTRSEVMHVTRVLTAARESARVGCPVIVG